MPTQRLHKVLLDASRDHFAALSDQGKPLNLNQAAQMANSQWPPYTEVCIETWELYPHEAPGGSHQHWVLRANVRCCCAGACHYGADHADHGYAQVSAIVPSPGTPAQTPHGPGQGYVEARLDMADLAALAAQAQAVVSDAAARGKLAALFTADAAEFSLSADEIEGHLGHVGADANGMLAAPGAVAEVLAGASTSANDYYCTAALLKLYQRLLYAVHQRLSRDWPQRGVARPIRLGARHNGGGQ